MRRSGSTLRDRSSRRFRPKKNAYALAIGAAWIRQTSQHLLACEAASPSDHFDGFRHLRSKRYKDGIREGGHLGREPLREMSPK